MYAHAADVYMIPAEEIVRAIEMVENHMDKVEKCWFYEELNRTVLSLFNETNKILPKLFCHITTKKLRGNKNVGRMAEKRARQQLGLKIGSYKDLFFGAELHQLEELNGQMPEFKKKCPKKALKNLVKDMTSLRGKNVHFRIKIAALATTEAFWLLRMFHRIGNSAP